MSRILVVEDESAIAELVGINLRHAGFEVAIAADAEQAQAEVDAVVPDLVILDWMLPGQSGLQLARRWRGQARTRALPVIMLTARVLDVDKVTGLDAGADDYLTKPFSPTELMARIRAVLRRKSPEALDSPVEVGPLRLDPATHRVSGHGQEVKMGRRSSSCSTSSSAIPSESTAERSCSTRSGAITSSSRNEPSMCMSSGFAKR